MTKRQQITKYIDDAHKRHGFTSLVPYFPTLGFKLTNFDNKSTGSFEVDSLDEAENIAISFISTFVKGQIFINDIFDETKQLYLRIINIMP